MKRPVVLIVGAAAGALLVAATGASAQTGFSLSKVMTLHSTTFGDEATGTRVEPSDSPEPTETPEAPPTAEPAEVDNEANDEVDNDVDTETNDETETKTPAPTSSGGDHESGGGGSTEHGD